jgi:hypothetical protein
MRSRRVSSEQIASDGAEQLAGAILLAPIRIGDRVLPKGTRIDAPLACSLRQAACEGGLPSQLRLAWGDPGDLHEDDAARRLAKAVIGTGVTIGAPSQSRVDLTAQVNGVLRVRIDGLAEVNRIDPLEVFTLFHGQAVRAKQTVASVKVAPHLVPEVIVEAGERVASRHAPLISVDPYLPLGVAAIAAEALDQESLGRFDRAARSKVGSLGGRFLGTSTVPDEDPEAAARLLSDTLRHLACERRVPLILVGGVSAGDPLAPLYVALEALKGRLLRRGVPAHPGSMIWLGTLEDTTLLGLPQCGMFSMATAADLVLPRLLTGERVTADTLADLGHGGLLGKEMRFRLPDYARDLDAPG